jgi:hypothetical protein
VQVGVLLLAAQRSAARGAPVSEAALVGAAATAHSAVGEPARLEVRLADFLAKATAIAYYADDTGADDAQAAEGGGAEEDEEEGGADQEDAPAVQRPRRPQRGFSERGRGRFYHAASRRPREDEGGWSEPAGGRRFDSSANPYPRSWAESIERRLQR